MKPLITVVLGLVAIFLLSAADVVAQVEPCKCEDNECCICASCCHTNIGYCSGTCSCSFSCGGGYGSCACECDPGEGAPMSSSELGSKLGLHPVCDISTEPLSLSARTQILTKDGPQRLSTIVTGIQKMSRWTVLLPPRFASREVEGQWNGTFDEVIHEIAWAYRLEALVDAPSQTITFVPPK